MVSREDSKLITKAKTMYTQHNREIVQTDKVEKEEGDVFKEDTVLIGLVKDMELAKTRILKHIKIRLNEHRGELDPGLQLEYTALMQDILKTEPEAPELFPAELLSLKKDPRIVRVAEALHRIEQPITLENILEMSREFHHEGELPAMDLIEVERKVNGMIK